MYVDLFDRWIIQLAVNSYLRVPNTQWGFPDDSVVKNIPAVAEDSGLIPGLGRSPGEGNNNPLQYTGKFCGQRSLAGYSPWDRKDSDRTEQLHFTSLLSFTFLDTSTM